MCCEVFLNCNILQPQMLQASDLLHINVYFVADCPTIVIRVCNWCYRVSETVTSLWCRVSEKCDKFVVQCVRKFDTLVVKCTN